MREPSMLHRLAAEFIGTFWLVFGGCGSAVFAAKFTADGTSLGIGFLGVALAFGLTVLTGVYAYGTISGGHFNPAVTLGVLFLHEPFTSRMAGAAALVFIGVGVVRWARSMGTAADSATAPGNAAPGRRQVA